MGNRRLLAHYARIDLLVIDEWGLTPLTEDQRQHMHELMEDRYDLRSTLLASRVPVEKWHTIIGDPSRADAILDRLVHNAHKIALKGDSLRKKHKKIQEGQMPPVARLRGKLVLAGFPHSQEQGTIYMQLL